MTGRQVELFYALLVSSGEYTFLPEIYDIFGRENAIKFLDVFAGKKLKIPKIERFESLARDAAIYMRIENATDGQKPIIVKALAEEYEMTEDRIRSLYVSTKYKFEEQLGFEYRRTKRVRT